MYEKAAHLGEGFNQETANDGVVLNDQNRRVHGNFSPENGGLGATERKTYVRAVG